MYVYVQYYEGAYTLCFNLACSIFVYTIYYLRKLNNMLIYYRARGSVGLGWVGGGGEKIS